MSGQFHCTGSLVMSAIEDLGCLRYVNLLLPELVSSATWDCDCRSWLPLLHEWSLPLWKIFVAFTMWNVNYICYVWPCYLCYKRLDLWINCLQYIEPWSILLYVRLFLPPLYMRPMPFLCHFCYIHLFKSGLTQGHTPTLLNIRTRTCITLK